MTVVSDSGPLIHLAIVEHFFLLKQYFHRLLVIPQVYGEVVTQGIGQPGAAELRQAVEEGWIKVESVTDQEAVQRFMTPNISATDATVVACALEKEAALVLADDTDVRGLAAHEGLAVTGTVGLLVRARLDGVISELKPLLDQLVASGFYLDSRGQVYRDALRRVGEIP
jgi:predicted nucleic acid-binding protein